MTIDVDGEPVTVTVSNVPPPGTPRRIYFFSAPPKTENDAASLAEHVSSLAQVLDEASLEER